MSIKKILLINPPFQYFPGFASKMTNYVRIPLGLCYLASYVRRINGVDVTIFDVPALGWDTTELKRRITDLKPDLIGISVVTVNVQAANYLIEWVKRILPGITVVVGGPHVTVMPQDLLKNADYAVLGEGEITFSELISCLNAKGMISEIHGLAYRHEGTIVKTDERDLISDLDALPFPALDLLDLQKYKHIYPYRSNGMLGSIITSRGCPHKCFFCGNETLWRGRVRHRSIKNVVEEIAKIQEELGVSLFWIDDDLFGPDARIREFCMLLKERALGVRWMCHMRCDAVSEETLVLMKETGCLEMQIGVESGNNNVLRAMNKRLTTSQIKNFFRVVSKVGINTWATFIFGLYGENKDTIRDSVRLAKVINPTYVTFIHLLPFPGTKVYSDYSRKGYIKTYDWSKYNWHSVPIFETENLSSGDLTRLKKRAYLSFYLRPRVLFSYLFNLRKMGSYRTLLKDFFTFVKLAFNI
ncbi:MAG TPA: radical SAM protein [Candidatus Omnitrophota bacterium]|nr:radical SAM protein [Candidatus Omnitrophota bacterium]